MGDWFSSAQVFESIKLMVNYLYTHTLLHVDANQSDEYAT